MPKSITYTLTERKVNIKRRQNTNFQNLFFNRFPSQAHLANNLVIISLENLKQPLPELLPCQQHLFLHQCTTVQQP